MDKRKLIGTIIGVAMFAALIAGATFAFLSFTATVTNATYNGTSMNFLVDYTQGTTITGLPQVKVGGPGAGTSSSLVVVLKKHNNSVDGHGRILFTTTSTGTLTTGGLVNWVICRDPDVEEGTQVDDVCGTNFDNAINSGVITVGGGDEIILLNDAALAENNSDVAADVTSDSNTYLIEEDGVSYFVYFWVNSTLINNSHINQTYTGYIHAYATQIVE